MNQWNEKKIACPEIIKKYGFKWGEDLMKSSRAAPIFFISEAGTGHQGDLERTIEMVDVCNAHGVAAIKFQHAIAEEILHPLCGEVKLSSGTVDLFHYFKNLETKADQKFWRKVMNYCQQKQILFLCSFFGHRSFLDLQSMGVEAYKVASPEMNHYQLWKDLLAVVDPVFFSSGVAKIEDLEHLMRYLDRCGFDKNRLVHLHCVTQYPAAVESYDLVFTQWFENQFGVLTGLSDHSEDPYILPVAFAFLKAIQGLPVVIEKHFTLEESGPNIDDPVSIHEHQLKELMEGLGLVYEHFATLQGNALDNLDNLGNLNDSSVGRSMEGGYRSRDLADGIREGLMGLSKKLGKQGDGDGEGWRNVFRVEDEKWEKIFGDGKRELTASEMADYLTTRRSLLSTRDIQQGEMISRENTAYLRSEKNLRPGLDYHWETKVLGLRVKRHIRNGEPITENDLE